MRALIFSVFVTSALLPLGAGAQEWASLPAVPNRMMQEYDVRWNSCYKETRLIYRTRNLSSSDYRAAIKDARHVHMQDCMARAQPPRPIARWDADEKQLPSNLAGWAANP